MYLRSLRRLAHESETARTPTKIDALRNHGPFRQAVESVTPLREADSAAAASDILTAADPLLAFAECAHNTPISVLNYLLAHHDMGYFGRRYFPHIFDMPHEPLLHGKMLPVLYGAVHGIIKTPIVIAGWRECGKSVCASLLAPIHANVFPAKEYYANGTCANIGKEYVMFLSLVKGGARKALRAVQYEYETNEALRRDFGEYYLINGHKPELWNKSEFLSPTGMYHEAMSRFTSLRGARERHRRPDLPVVDDVEDVRLSVNSPERRTDDMNWFTNEFVPAVDTRKGVPIMLGNFPYPGCMSMKLSEYGEKHGWTVLTFALKQVINGQEIYTCPNRFGPEFETKKKNDLMFESAWQAEYMLNPSAMKSEISEDDCKGYDLAWLLRERLRYCRVYIALDPAIGMSNTADKTAIVPLAFDTAQGKKYVLPIVNERGLELDAIVSRFVGLYVRYHPRVSRMGVEAVGFQRTLKTNIEAEFKRQGMSQVVHPIQQGSRMDKRGRIRRTWPGIKREEFLFLLEDEAHREMIQQIINEHSDHDDAADAFEMSDRLIIDEAVEREKSKHTGSMVRARTLSKSFQRKEKPDETSDIRGRAAAM